MPKVHDEPVLVTPVLPVKRRVKQEDREVVHPVLTVRVCLPKGTKIEFETFPPVTAADMKKVLGWESEKDYITRRLEEDPKLSESKLKFGDNYFCTDYHGQKVRCKNNGRNRRFDESHGRKLANQILRGVWAGPTCYPGETINGETGIITRTGQVVSVQHRGFALIWATDEYNANPAKWKKYWPDGPPVMDGIFVLGVSDSHDIIKTLDNTKVRTFDDTVYQSDTFRDLTDAQRWVCSQMYAASTNFLWSRTGGDVVSGKQQYRSNATLDSFAENHQTIEKFVRFIFDVNHQGGDRDKIIGNMGLPMGLCPSVLYLMATADSNGEQYREGDKYGVRSEKKLDWSLLDKAKGFWAELVKDDCGELASLVEALADVIDEATGAVFKLSQSQKWALVAMAWHAFKEGDTITRKHLDLGPYMTAPSGADKLRLTDPPVFGALDLGPKPGLEEEPDNAEELIENGKAEVEEERIEEAPEVIAEAGAEPSATNGKKSKKKKDREAENEAPSDRPLTEQIEDIRKEHPGKVLLFQGAAIVNVFNGDIDLVKKVTGSKPIKTGKQDELTWAAWPRDHTTEIVAELKVAGHKVCVVTKDKRGGNKVEVR